MKEELREKARRDDLLYEKFAKALKSEHHGEFVAVSPEGKIILGKDDLEVLKKALEEFGKGNFAFRRIGFKTLGKWRRCGGLETGL